jgi:hypothetical protein
MTETEYPSRVQCSESGKCHSVSGSDTTTLFYPDSPTQEDLQSQGRRYLYKGLLTTAGAIFFTTAAVSSEIVLEINDKTKNENPAIQYGCSGIVLLGSLFAVTSTVSSYNSFIKYRKLKRQANIGNNNLEMQNTQPQQN